MQELAAIEIIFPDMTYHGYLGRILVTISVISTFIIVSEGNLRSKHT